MLGLLSSKKLRRPAFSPSHKYPFIRLWPLENMDEHHAFAKAAQPQPFSSLR
jgi:hypothetical protein